MRTRNFQHAKQTARTFARRLNEGGILAQNMYAYPCDKCSGWHLTRQAGWENCTLALRAATEELQKWAMGE